VAINAQRVLDLATQVEEKDRVTVDGSPVHPAVAQVIVLNKPAGYLCTREDTHGRPTIYDILPGKFQHLHHVGRLDQDSEGLLLLTNQGDLSQRLLHPSEGVEKEYEVTLDKEFDANHVAKLVRGIQTVEGFGRAEHVHIDAPRRLHVVLKQGLKRQIRLMFYELGYEVTRLVRVRIGSLKISGLGLGQWKELRSTEVEQFFKAAKPRVKKSNVRAEEDGDDDAFPTTRRRVTPTAGKDSRSAPSDRRSSGGSASSARPRLGGARKTYGEKRYGGGTSEGKGGTGDRPRRFSSSSSGASSGAGRGDRPRSNGTGPRSSRPSSSGGGGSDTRGGDYRKGGRGGSSSGGPGRSRY
jgi:23S rRNA pseudouridine2605 synthase